MTNKEPTNPDEEKGSAHSEHSPDGGTSLNDSDPKPEASMTEEKARQIQEHYNRNPYPAIDCSLQEIHIAIAHGYLERVEQENDEIKWRKYSREEDKARIEDLKELLIVEREKIRFAVEKLEIIANTDPFQENNPLNVQRARATLTKIKELK